jgi:hypothetical protein
MLGARIFVGVVFTILGAAFLASTGLLIHEFQNGDVITMVVAHSNLFLFFPVLGMLALFGFYLPATIFTHLYFTKIPFGIPRFLFGFLVVIAATWGVDRYLDTSPRAIWELSAATIAADKGEEGNCEAGQCRQPIGKVLPALRDYALKGTALSKFARNCKDDPYLEEPEDFKLKRFCFPALAQLDGRACCAAQKKFSTAVDTLYADPTKRSQAARFDRILMPLKIFFVVVIIVIGVLLAIWRDKVDEHYERYVPAMERGIIIGAFAMLLWPVMDYGYLTTTYILFGHFDTIPQVRLSIVIAPWVLLLLFYFLRRLGEQGELVGQISGVVVAAVTVLRYQEINDWATKLLGVGMPKWVLVTILCFLAAGLAGLAAPWSIPGPQTRDKAKPAK